MDPQKYTQGIKEGWFVHFRHNFYRITELEPGGKIVIQNVDNPSDTIFTSIAALIRDSSDEYVEEGNDNNLPPITFAPDLETIYAQIEASAPLPESSESLKINPKLTLFAKELILVVEDTEKYIEEARERCIALGRPHDFRKGVALLDGLSRVPPEIRVGKTQYYEYLKLYKKHNGIERRIAAALQRSTKGKTKFSKQILHFCDTHILNHYIRSQAISKSETFRELCKIWRRNQGYWIDVDKCRGSIPNALIDELLDPRISIDDILENPQKANLLSKIKLPSQSWVIKYIKWFEAHPDRGEAVMVHRYGPEHWENFYKVFDSFVHKAAFPRHYVVFDHWLLDMFSVDENDPTKVFRLWVTMGIDVYSRAIMSLTLSEEYPNIETVQENLLHMIWPKNPLEEIGVDMDWVAYGIPLTLSLDNNWAQQSHSLEALARDISQNKKYDSITLMLRPPYKARYGNVIERVFGNLSVKIKAKFAGAGAILSSNPKEVGTAKEQAIFTPRDIYLFLYKEVLNYMHTPHSSLNGMTPHEKFLEGLKAVGEPIVPPLTPRMKRYFLRLHHEPKTITEKGIGLFSMHYDGPTLASAERVDAITGRAIEYVVRYTKKDNSVISLFREDVFIGELKAKERLNPDGSVRPLSWEDYKLAKERAKAKGKGPGQWLEEVNSLDDTHLVDELKETRAREKKKFIQNQNKPATNNVVSDTQQTQNALSNENHESGTKPNVDKLLSGFLGTK